MEITPKNPNTPKKKQKSKWIRFKYPSRPEVFEAFAEWMAWPKSIRKPKNQQDFARLHEISPDSLSDYKKKLKFWEKVEEKKAEIKSSIEDSRLLEKAVFLEEK